MIFNQKLSIKKYSTFLIIMFLSCSANKSFHNKKSLKVLEQEIARSIDRNNIENKLYLSFNSNNELISFIKETMSDSIQAFSINKILKEGTYKRIFNNVEVSNYERQLKNNFVKVEKINFSNKLILYNDSKNDNHIDDYTKRYLFLSMPLFTSNNKYCLISSSIGTINETSGVVNVYKNVNGNWVYYRTIDSWL